MKELLSGNQIIIKSALDAGAEAFFGYPITPATGILEEWSRLANCSEEYKGKLISLQTEDEISAGFALIGAVLAGKKAFTATSGPGNVLMQDAFSMAEAMRLPTVAFIMQRGGPSTGTVIYSQCETNLTCFGGNGEGFRIVYSSSSIEELYKLGRKAFNAAWKYRFPTFVLSDGYQAKMVGDFNCEGCGNCKNVFSEPYLLSSKIDLVGKMPKNSFLQDNDAYKQYTSLRNCYDLEEELRQANDSSKEEFEKIREEIEEWEEINPSADCAIIAHGTVGAAAKEAILNFKRDDLGLFRPITLNPFPEKTLRDFVDGKDKIIILESANGQMGRLVKAALQGVNIKIQEVYKLGEGFYPEEIKSMIN
ncbi:MAG: ferredoxin oxidoreductase [bacterium]